MRGQAHVATACWVALGGVLPLCLWFPYLRGERTFTCGWPPSPALPSVPHTLCQSREKWIPGRAGVTGREAEPRASYLAGAHAVVRDRGQAACACEGARGRRGARHCGHRWMAPCLSPEMYVVRVDGALPVCPQVSGWGRACVRLCPKGPGSPVSQEQCLLPAVKGFHPCNKPHFIPFLYCVISA